MSAVSSAYRETTQSSTANVSRVSRRQFACQHLRVPAPGSPGDALSKQPSSPLLKPRTPDADGWHPPVRGPGTHSLNFRKTIRERFLPVVSPWKEDRMVDDQTRVAKIAIGCGPAVDSEETSSKNSNGI